jgi:hypothetical protein
MMSSYNNGGLVWNAEAEETALRSYTIEHEFNKPAKCMITLADPTGTLMQKYNADANDVYLGVGKITLEDPTGTDIFYGRIKRVTADSESRVCVLECYDWLDQLNDEVITYDMREKLGTSDMRQSMLRSDVDGLRICVENDAGTFYAYDDGAYDTDGEMAFANDQHNGQYMIFTVGMAGTKTWTFHPEDSTATDHDIYGDNVHQVWVNDAGVDSGFANNDWTLQYDFQVELGHNTPSDFYVHDSITGARVECRHQISQLGGSNHAHLKIYDNNAAAWSSEISRLVEADVAHQQVHEIPTDIVPYIVDATGLLKILYDIDRTAGNATLSIHYFKVELDVATTGYSTPVLINDTINPNKFEVNTDLTAAATQMWEGVPYCIVEPIYKHLDTAESVGLSLFTDEGVDGDGAGPDPIIKLTAGATVEHTTGLSATQFKDKTRLKIVQSLAHKDSAVFWITLGGTTVTYKKTFGADTQQLTDGSVLSWQSLHDYNTMINSVEVYGVRIGDIEIYQQSENAASILKYLSTKSKVIRNTGLVSDAEASDIGIAIAARENDIEQMVGCSIYGNTITAGHATTIKLGEIVEITSSYLWPAAAAKDYIVSRLVYDSASNITKLTMYPKASTGNRVIEFPDPQGEEIKRRLDSDTYIPDPVTHEVV